MQVKKILAYLVCFTLYTDKFVKYACMKGYKAVYYIHNWLKARVRYDIRTNSKGSGSPRLYCPGR